MRAVFREATAAELLAFEAVATAAAWERWAEESCVEWHGGHPWMLTIDCGSASVRCPACGAEPMPDHADSLVAEFPVRVEIESHHYPGGPWGSDEWDVWVHAEPKSPYA